MKERAAELRAEGRKGAKKADGLQALLDRIAEMAPEDRALAERVHVVVTTHATFAGGTVFEPTELNRQLVLLAHELGRANVADLCVAYSLGHPFVDSIAVGTRSNQQMIDDLAYCLNAPLTADEPPTTFPRGNGVSRPPREAARSFQS